MTYNAFILCDLVWKVQKSHAANREGSFNLKQIKCAETMSRLCNGLNRYEDGNLPLTL